MWFYCRPAEALRIGITNVNLLNPAQTGLFQVTWNTITSLTLGPFSAKMAKSYFQEMIRYHLKLVEPYRSTVTSRNASLWLSVWNANINTLKNIMIQNNDFFFQLFVNVMNLSIPHFSGSKLTSRCGRGWMPTPTDWRTSPTALMPIYGTWLLPLRDGTHRNGNQCKKSLTLYLFLQLYQVI